MNILLWVLQAALALFAFAGGAYKVFQFDALAKSPSMADLSRGGWRAVGVFEMACAVLLFVVPPIGAAALALESLALAVLYGRHSTALTSTNPLVYVVVIGLMAAFVAYGRYALSPA